MKSKQLEEALEIARQHVLETHDTAMDAVDKYWEEFSFDPKTTTFLAKRGFMTLLTSDLRSPSRPQFTRQYEVTERASTPVEKLISGTPMSTYHHKPILRVKPSKVLTSVVDQILNNVALEGANGRRILLRNFTVFDCDHYDKNQSFIVNGIERKRQVVANIKARLKQFAVKQVSDLPPKEQTFIAREWKNAEKGIATEAFAMAAGK
jgi:hypothetical protein